MGKPAETDRPHLKSLSHSFTLDLVILIDAERRSDWLVKAIDRRLRGVREAPRGDQRGQESDGGSEEGRELHFPGFSVSAHTQPSAEVAATLCANAEEANRAVWKAQGDLPAACQLARQECD